MITMTKKNTFPLTMMLALSLLMQGCCVGSRGSDQTDSAALARSILASTSLGGVQTGVRASIDAKWVDVGYSDANAMVRVRWNENLNETVVSIIVDTKTMLVWSKSPTGVSYINVQGGSANNASLNITMDKDIISAAELSLKGESLILWDTKLNEHPKPVSHK